MSTRRSWSRDEQGSFAVYAAVTFPILLALLGFGLDYWTVLSAKSRLDAAADSAAIAAVQAAVSYIQSNPQGLSGTALQNAAAAVGQTAAQSAFAANGGPSVAQANAVLSPNPPAVSCPQNNCTATVTYTAGTHTSFSTLVGFNQFSFGGTAQANQHAPLYINVYVLIDNSQSMGIGADQTNINRLWTVTSTAGRSCQLACHDPEGEGVSYEQLAHQQNPPIQLRIDAARAAVYDMAQSALQNSTSSIQFAIYTMQDTPAASANTGPNAYTGQLINQIFPTSGKLSNDYNALSTAMAATNYTTLSLGNNESWSDGDSKMDCSIQYFTNNVMTQSGDGSSATSAINYVFIVTDGITDWMQSGNGCYNYGCGRYMGAISATDCDALKNNFGSTARVGVIYTTYTPIYNNNDPTQGFDPNYSGLVLPYVGLVPGNLANCASPSTSTQTWYYQASDGATLQTDMNKLFASALSTVLQTQ